MKLLCVALHCALLAWGLRPPRRAADRHGGEADNWGGKPDEEDFDDSDEDASFQEDFEAGPAPRDAEGDPSACAGCRFTIDLSCPFSNIHSSNYFHRIVDCLVPMYGLLELARARTADGAVCILTGVRRTPNLVPLLSTLIADMEGVGVVDYGDQCARSLARHAVNPVTLPRYRQSYAKAFPTLPNVVDRHSIDLRANVRALRRDVSRVATPHDRRPLVLIQRERTRAFEPGTAASLRDMLRGVVSAQVERSRDGLAFFEFTPNMTVKQTLDLFTNAAGVVGYHGAGHANTLFTAHPSCVMEISTYRTLEWKPWRSNSELANQNDMLFWHTVLINLQTLLDANKYAGKLPDIRKSRGPMDKFGHTDRKLTVARSRWIKNLRNVRLLNDDIMNVEKTLTDCLRFQVFPLM
jgi:hypothetical protein